MQKDFSWMQIHVEGKNYVLYLYNKNGLVKKLFSSRELEIVQNSMERHQATKTKIGKALAEAIEKLKTDSEALKRLQAHK